jgi:hypothetical protein
LYKDITIVRREQLGALALRLVRPGSSSQPGSWIKLLTVLTTPDEQDEDDSDVKAYHDNINTILIHTSRLQRFSVTFEIHPLSVSILSSAAYSTVGTIICHVHPRITSVFHRFATFSSMTRMILSFRRPLLSTLEGIVPWIMPQVTHFQWTWSPLAGDIDDHAVTFIAGCRFDSNSTIVLVIPSLTTRQSMALDPFFVAHRNSDQAIILMREPISSSSTIMGISHVAFLSILPEPRLFEIAELPEQIRFEFDVTEEADALWRILTALERRVQTSTPLMIHICLSNMELDQRFLWQRPADEFVPASHSRFVGRLVPYALRLRSRGISILDEEQAEIELLPGNLPGTSET